MGARLTLLILALVVGCCGSVRAANPRISLALENVTGAEAAAALGKAAQVSVDLPDPRSDPMGQVAKQLQERASFNWSNVRFAAALRQLCARYNLRVQRLPGDGYTLYPALGPLAGPVRRVGLTEKNGVRLFVRRITVSQPREINFEEVGFGPNPGSMSLYLGGELADSDADAIAGFSGISAKDDLGNLLVSDFPRVGTGFGGLGGSGSFPDEFSGSIQLPAPHPKARKLVWLEGELLGHKRVRPVSVEVPLPVGPQGARRQVEDATVEVYRVEVATEKPGADGDPQGSRVSVQARASWPSTSPIAPRGPSTGTVTLRGASGKLFRFASGGTSGGGGGGRQTYTYNLTFQSVDEPVAAVVFTLLERSPAETLFTFRMADIPLPEDPAFVPRRAVPRAPARTVVPEEPQRPFFDRNGGRLAHRIVLRGRPAPEGTLSLGLAPRDGAGWGPVRWTDLPVSGNGTAVLPDLKPGTYRLLRVYRTKEATALRGDGTWQNAEVTVEVGAGKESAAPPLIWAPRLASPATPKGKR